MIDKDKEELMQELILSIKNNLNMNYCDAQFMSASAERLKVLTDLYIYLNEE